MEKQRRFDPSVFQADSFRFSKAMIAAAKSNIDDIIEYLYSLSSMTSITGIPKQAKKDILTAHTTNGILNVPKEYGMFIVS